MKRFRVGQCVIVVLALVMGLLSFVQPFLRVVFTEEKLLGGGHSSASSLTVGIVLITIALVAMLLELQTSHADARSGAMIGVLVAITSILRFVEIAVPLPGGFSPIFAPIIIVGWVFGSSFGFLMGALTMLVSSLITGGIGPWLPYQMFAAGWVGLSTGLCRSLRDVLVSPGRAFGRLDLAVLVFLGVLWGILYGAVINLYFWPFAMGPADQSWSVGIGLAETLKRYLVFYGATSFLWDIVRGVGNAALLIVVGLPTARALERFERRFGHKVVARV